MSGQNNEKVFMNFCSYSVGELDSNGKILSIDDYDQEDGIHFQMEFIFSDLIQSDDIPLWVYLNDIENDGKIMNSDLVGRYNKRWDVRFKDDKIIFPLNENILISIFTDGDAMISEMIRVNGEARVKKQLYFYASQYASHNKSTYTYIVNQFKSIKRSSSNKTQDSQSYYLFPFGKISNESYERLRKIEKELKKEIKPGTPQFGPN